MVATQQIVLDKFPSFAHVTRVARTADHRDFVKRLLYVDEPFMNQYHKRLSKLAPTLSENGNFWLKDHLEQIDEGLLATRQYITPFPSVLADEQNTLELLGAPIYAKKYQIIYDFTTHLDVLLAYLAGIPYERLCDNLQQNLRVFQVSYPMLSQAVMTHNTRLLADIPIGVFFNLAPALDRFFEAVLSRNHKCAFLIKGETFAFKHEEMSHAEMCYYSLGFQMWELLQYIFEEFIALYNAGGIFTSQYTHSITSKGYANIVLQSDVPEGAQELSLSLGDSNFLVKPLVSRRGHYFETLLEGLLC